MRQSVFTRDAIALGLLVLLTACSTNPPAGEGHVAATDPYNDADYAEDPVICRRQRVVGSNVPVRVCKTQSQMQKERDALEREIGSLRPFTGDTRGLDANTYPNH